MTSPASSAARVRDVAVIGGGLAGCATAYYLARDGVDVILVEGRDLNTQASGSNAGSLHAQIPHDPFANKGQAWAEVFAPTVALLARSIAIWRGLENELGSDLEVSLKGGLLVAGNEKEMAEIERKAAIERAQGLDVRLLDREGVRAVAPYLVDGLAGGAFCPDEGKANPLAVTPAFARAAERAGATILRDRPVQALERAGGAFRIATGGGDILARRVVNAAGSQAGRVAAMVTARPLGIQAFPIQVSASERVAAMVPHLVYFAGEKLTLKQNGAGSLLIGGGWEARLDARGHPVVDPLSLMRNLAVARRVMPGLEGVRIVRSWAAFVNGTDDWKPILGEMPGVPGFFVNFFPWMGFTAGPVAARITASLVQGKAPPVDMDLSPFLLG